MTVERSLAVVFAVAVLAGGCAMRPASTQSAAPPPAAPASTASTPPRPAPPAPPAATPARPVAPPAVASPAARPVPSEFRSVSDVKDVFFDFDKYEIRAQDAKVLDANAVWLRTNAGHLLLIEGHADSRGTNEYNLVLAERRAKATMNYLVSNGIAPSRITIVSYGEERPACIEKAEGCWAKNRRAHFLVKPR
jgi:peptidoglycan-associated lipoprotein